jgi:methylamine--corrinoid protein Co-methyltransferase
MKALGKALTVFDVYDRAYSGPKMAEATWDYEVIPQTTAKLVEKYNIKMDKKTIVPEDPELINNLFKAGVDLLEECGVYCISTGRIIKYSRDEILNAIECAPDHFQFGEDTEAHTVVPRSYDSPIPPIIQGGPTGAPCSEEMFLPIHQGYAMERIVDTIVDGVMQTINGHDPLPGSAWEIMAVRSEIWQVREGMIRAGRHGMGL